jgi:hypothetical protein
VLADPRHAVKLLLAQCVRVRDLQVGRFVELLLKAREHLVGELVWRRDRLKLGPDPAKCLVRRRERSPEEAVLVVKRIDPGERITMRRGEKRPSKTNPDRMVWDWDVRFHDAPPLDQAELFGLADEPIGGDEARPPFDSDDDDPPFA